ncbi:MAG: GNAT family N-acetyltransferase [Thalassovita sp.]
MIIVVDALNRHLFQDLLSEMHALRARVFQDRLGWNVSVKDGKEIDEYDNLNPAHVICLDDEGDVVGCMRLLQTTGPHMMADVFSAILDGEPPLRSAQIWEATRFCVDTQKLKGKTTRNSISYVTTEVMIGAFEFAQKAGVLDAVAVIDPVMNRVMIRSKNAPYDYLGSTKQMGKVKAMAALMDCSDERIKGLRDFASIHHDVFASDQEALDKFNARPAAQPTDFPEKETLDMAQADKAPTLRDLQNYCNEQIAEATTEEGRQAAYALQLELAELLRGPSRLHCDA